MRIELDLPPWCDERHIYVMAGIEMVAYKLAQQDKIWVKEERCVKCGRCCTGLNPNGKDILQNGDCLYLEQHGHERLCSLGVDRPHLCSVGLQQKGRVPGCTVEYK